MSISEHLTRFYWFSYLSVAAAQWFRALLLAINLSISQKKLIWHSIHTWSSNHMSLVLLPQFRKLDNELTPSYQHTLMFCWQPTHLLESYTLCLAMTFYTIIYFLILFPYILTLQSTISVATFLRMEMFPIHSGFAEDFKTKANNFTLLKELLIFNVSYKSLFGILVKEYQSWRYTDCLIATFSISYL